MENIKRRINRIGKVCRIISLVLMILSIVAASVLIIGGAVLSLMPQDMVQAEVAATADVTVSGRLVNDMSKETAEKIADAVKGQSSSYAVNAKTEKTVETNEQKIVVHSEEKGMQFTLRRIGLSLLCMALIAGCLIPIFIMLGRMMKQLEICDSPFTEGVIKSMTTFAFSLIPYAVLRPLVSSLASSLLVTGEFNVDFSVDLTVVFVVLIILLLVTIFKYGAKLQNESDETL